MNRRAQRQHGVAAILAGLLVAGALGGAAGAGIRDLDDGWLLDPTATAALLGARSPRPAPLWLVVGQGRLYGLSELPLAAATLGLRGRRWTGGASVQIGWRTLGAGLYREDERRLRLTWGRRVGLGAEFRAASVRTGGWRSIGERTDSWWQVDAVIRADWQPTDPLAVTTCLWIPLAGARALAVRNRRQRLATVQARHGGLGVAVALDLDSDRSPDLGWEGYLAAGGAAWGLRVEPSVGAFGPVLAWRRGRVLLRTSHLSHPQLGVTHRFEVGFGLGGAAP